MWAKFKAACAEVGGVIVKIATTAAKGAVIAAVGLALFPAATSVALIGLWNLTNASIFAGGAIATKLAGGIASVAGVKACAYG